MQKRVADSEDESTPVSDGKRPRRSSLKDWAIIQVNSPDRDTNDQPILEGAPNGVSAPLEEGIPARGPNVDEINERSPSGTVSASIPPPRPADTLSSRRRLPYQMLLSTYIPPYERIHPPTGMVSPDLEGAQEIIHHWSPFNQAEPLVTHMGDLYPNYFRELVVAHVEHSNMAFVVTSQGFRMACSTNSLQSFLRI